MQNCIFVTSRALAQDGITYTISVYKTDAGFMAFCDCQSCGSHNLQTQPGKDRESAIKGCEELIRHHHKDHHCPAVKT